MFESPRIRSLRKFYRDGRTVIVPIDHAVAIPVEALAKPGPVIEKLNPHADGYVVNCGVAVACREQLHGKGVCLRVDSYNTRTDSDGGSGALSLWDTDFAYEIKAHAVMSMLFTGHPLESEMLQFNAKLVRSSFRTDMPVIMEALPAGLGQHQAYTVERVAFTARLAAELGADVVKTVYPPGASVEEFAKIVESCFVPLIILGGAAMGDDRALLEMTSNAMKAGATGIAIGRNVWQHPRPAAILNALAAVVHDSVSAEEALALL